MARITCVLVLWSFYLTTAHCQAENIIVTPNSDQVISVSSPDNVTYSCEVEAGATVIWQVDSLQIPRDGDVASGQVVDNSQGPTISALTITAGGRSLFGTPTVEDLVYIPILCLEFNTSTPGSVPGPEFQIVIFGPPPPPRMLLLNPDPQNLTIITLTWSPPPLQADLSIPLTYTVTVVGATFNRTETTALTSFTFAEAVSECEESTFSVVARNEAGPSSTAMLEDTIPISATVDDISRELRVASIELAEGGGVRVTVTFPPTTQCSDSFPISNYSVNVLRTRDQTLSSTTVTGESVQGQEVITVELRSAQLPNLRQDEQYNLSVSACIAITCRDSTSIPLITTDVQSATITYFGNIVQLACSFVNASAAQGCVLRLMISDNGTETFALPRNGMQTATQCNITNNQINAYDQLEALDWESDGSIGTVPILVSDEDTFVADNFTTVTGCRIGGGGGLSAGAIVGIVIAIIGVVVIVTVLVVVFAVFRYNIRDKLWGKVKEENDMITVDLEKFLLMDASQRKRTSVDRGSLSQRMRTSLNRGNKLKPGASAPSPDLPVDSIDSKVSSPGSSLPPAGLHPPNTSLSSGASGGPPEIMPQMSESIQPAIQLDISDQRKVRIHLNRTLIRKVLEEHKRVSTLQQTAKPSRGGSSRRLKTDTDARNAMMLPIHSIVRILPGIAEHPSARESRDLGGGGEGDDDEVRLSQL